MKSCYIHSCGRYNDQMNVMHYAWSISVMWESRYLMRSFVPTTTETGTTNTVCWRRKIGFRHYCCGVMPASDRSSICNLYCVLVCRISYGLVASRRHQIDTTTGQNRLLLISKSEGQVHFSKPKPYIFKALILKKKGGKMLPTDPPYFCITFKLHDCFNKKQ